VGLPELVTSSEGGSDADRLDGDGSGVSGMDDDLDEVADTSGVPGLTPGGIDGWCCSPLMLQSADVAVAWCCRGFMVGW
jgi:hypothetical protein